MTDQDIPLDIIEDDESEQGHEALTWKLLVVDDEEEIHSVTRLALEGFSFAGRSIEFLHAHSGQQGMEMMREHPDVALILLDVVMETDHSGLDVVQYVREALENRFVRIVLRTGQPGQAPEHKVITEYDINDYKHKTELTRQKLFTVVHTSISSYRDLIALDANRRGLRKVIDAISKIFEARSMDQFAQGVLEQLAALLYIDRDAVVLRASGLAASQHNSHPVEILAGIGCFSEMSGLPAEEVLEPDVMQRVLTALDTAETQFGDDHVSAYYGTGSGVRNVLYIAGEVPLQKPDQELIELFFKNVSIAQDNLRLLSEARASG